MKAQGEGVRVIVIDDQSVDDTAEEAKRCGVQVIRGTSSPVGWSGKLWALEQGLQEIRTPYTLLLDADIVLTPGIIAEQPPMKNFIESLLMPAFVFFFKLLYPFGLANKSRSRVAAAAGGCILVETQALRSVGAFANLHHALIDDCTLSNIPSAQVYAPGLGSVMRHVVIAVTKH